MSYWTTVSVEGRGFYVVELLRNDGYLKEVVHDGETLTVLDLKALAPNVAKHEIEFYKKNAEAHGRELTKEDIYCIENPIVDTYPTAAGSCCISMRGNYRYETHLIDAVCEGYPDRMFNYWISGEGLRDYTSGIAKLGEHATRNGEVFRDFLVINEKLVKRTQDKTIISLPIKKDANTRDESTEFAKLSLKYGVLDVLDEDEIRPEGEYVHNERQRRVAILFDRYNPTLPVVYQDGTKENIPLDELKSMHDYAKTVYAQKVNRISFDIAEEDTRVFTRYNPERSTPGGATNDMQFLIVSMNVPPEISDNGRAEFALDVVYDKTTKSAIMFGISSNGPCYNGAPSLSNVEYVADRNFSKVVMVTKDGHRIKEYTPMSKIKELYEAHREAIREIRESQSLQLREANEYEEEER